MNRILFMFFLFFLQSLCPAGNGLVIFQDAISREDANTLNQIFANNRTLFEGSSLDTLDAVLAAASNRYDDQLRANTVSVIHKKQKQLLSTTPLKLFYDAIQEQKRTSFYIILSNNPFMFRNSTGPEQYILLKASLINGNDEMYKVLLNSMLFIAAETGKIATATTLLKDAQANYQLPHFSNMTALHIAALMGRESMVNLLRANNFSNAITDVDDKRPSDLAREAGHDNLALDLES